MSDLAEKGFVVVRGLVSPEDAQETVHQTQQIEYFRTHVPGNAGVEVAKLKGREILRGTGLGRVLEAVGANGQEFGLDLEHETRNVRGKELLKGSRVDAYEIMPAGKLGIPVGSKIGAAAIITLEGELRLGSRRQPEEHVAVGDVAFLAEADATNPYYIRAGAGRTAIALVVAGQKLPAETMATT